MKALAALAWGVMLAGVLGVAATARAQCEPLHSLIDQRLSSTADIPPARCSDAEFLRRASLDLIGMPPTAEEAKAFLADSSADKRERWIDRLFASPHYARHLAAVLDLMLMERRPNTHVSADEWQAWLLKSVRENKPWNVLAREILAADGDDPAQRPAARFALDRASDANVLTRDIGRVFFGRDMQCAQCHDHPLVGEYLQSDYHGLLAFVSPTYAMVRKEGDKQTTLQAEKAGTDLTFESVFVHVPRRTGARLPDEVVLDEPFFLPGEEYAFPPADNVKSVPKFSRRAKLAELATSGSNQAFNRNIVNRLWAHMFGRGLVHPVDMHHPDNPPSDPELLRLLSEQFAVMNFDMRSFLRELALTAAYQRSFDLPTRLLSLSTHAAQEAAALKERRAALQQAAETSASAYNEAAAAWESAEAAMLPVAGELDTAKTQYADAKKKVDDAVKVVTDASTQLKTKQTASGPLEQAAVASQEAAKVLAEDKELVNAAQLLTSRAELIKSEVTVLTKTVEEKTAAVKPLADAWETVKPTVETARQKVTPLSSTFREKEQAMLSTRLRATADAEALAALDRRLATTRRIARLARLDRAIEAANDAFPLRKAEAADAQQKLSEHAPVLAEREVAVKAATDAIAVVDARVNAASGELAGRVGVAQAIEASVQAVDVALQKVPGDAVLADAGAKLRERVTIAQAAAGEAQRQVELVVAEQKSANEALAAAQKSHADAVAQQASLTQAVEAANAALVAATNDVAAARSKFDSAVVDLADRWTNDFTVASLKPLTPEQLCWTVFQVTGVYHNYWQIEVAELDKTKPLTDAEKQDSAAVAAREVELEQRTFDKLKGNVGTFVAFYGAAAGQPQGDFFATADQALFAANGGSINSWVVPSGDNVTDRIIKQQDPRVAAEELYLTLLTRLPSEAEATEVVAYLNDHAADKNTAAQELVWGLLNSAEFRFNH